MTEYIEREALFGAIGLRHEIDGNHRAAQILECILEAPAADVAPVVHGRWIDPEDDDGGTLWHCSKCGYPVKTIAKPNCNYCPKCGCKMREGNDGTK